MERERLDELTELRFRHFERFSSAMFESQQEMMRLLTENTKLLAKLVTRMDNLETRMGNLETRMDSLEKRADRTEELLTLVLDDLAFIKNHLQRRE
ncbi:MAG: hypothetical protein OXG84_18190 [Chloroflexi bacterium]|nr:hypothetical protein [Chloroflexota bacterium]